MKVKKCNRNYDMVFVDYAYDDINKASKYINKQLIENDMYKDNVVCCFYLLKHGINNETEYVGKAVVYKSISPHSRFPDTEPYTVYLFTLSDLNKSLPLEIKVLFCAKISITVMCNYGSHLWLIYDNDNTVKSIAQKVGYNINLKSDCARYEQDDIQAYKKHTIKKGQLI